MAERHTVDVILKGFGPEESRDRKEDPSAQTLQDDK